MERDRAVSLCSLRPVCHCLLLYRRSHPASSWTRMAKPASSNDAGQPPPAYGVLPTMKELIDRDRLNQADKREVATACVSIFDRIQDLPKHVQLLALAAAFTLMAHASRFPAQDAFAATKNLMHDPLTRSGIAPQFQAMDFHLRTELLAGDGA